MDLAESLSPHSRLRYSAWFQVRRLKPPATRLVAFGTVAVLVSKMGSPSLVLSTTLTVPPFPLAPVSARSCFRSFLFPLSPRFITAADCGEAVKACSRLRSWRMTTPP